MKVLLLDNWCDEAKAIVGEVVEVVELEPVPVPIDYPKHFGGIIARLDCPLNYDILKDFSELKFIASPTTGLDHIDTHYAKLRGIDIIHLDDRDFLRDVWATAEHTWALILSLIRKVPFAHNDVCAGNWNREAWQGTELRGKTLGIVGYGRVGQQVAELAKAFKMNVVFCDKEHDMKVLLRYADIITVHIPLNDETRGMFGAAEFAMMKPTAYFVNTSRAGVVDPVALWEALTNGEIAGAALDVMEGYNDIDRDSLLDITKYTSNLIITPHIAGNAAESRRKTQLHIAQRIKDYIGGG